MAPVFPLWIGIYCAAAVLWRGAVHTMHSPSSFISARRTMSWTDCSIRLKMVIFGVDDGTGNRAWLKFPGIPFSIQPSEVVKLHKFSSREKIAVSLPHHGTSVNHFSSKNPAAYTRRGVLNGAKPERVEVRKQSPGPLCKSREIANCFLLPNCVYWKQVRAISR